MTDTSAEKEPLGLDCDECREEDEDDVGTPMEFYSREGDKVTYECPQCGYTESIIES